MRVASLPTRSERDGMTIPSGLAVRNPGVPGHPKFTFGDAGVFGLVFTKWRSRIAAG